MTEDEMKLDMLVAELDGQAAAAEHLRIILDTRNKVAFDQ